MTEALALIPPTFDATWTLAKTLAPSTLLPAALRGKEADVFMQLLAGRELGLPPMASIRGFHVIEGVPRLTADTMVAVVSAHSLCEYFRPVETTEDHSTWETKRRGHPEPYRGTYTMADQLKVGIKDGSGWKKYPKRMLSARAKSFLARDVYPEILAGILSVDEMEDAEPAAGPSRGQAIDAVFQTVTGAVVAGAAAGPPVLTDQQQGIVDTIMNALRDAEDESSVKTIIASVAKEDAPVREALKGTIKERLAQVRLAAKLEAEHAAAAPKDVQP